ncbi:hypothetical protein [Calothrix sp. CCY 0018]|uniref:hypothetical protein n=1 Tax=Calothrix sp. CCY 0018 TaxID=3103864 RepID=UPI0039C6D573
MNNTAKPLLQIIEEVKVLGEWLTQDLKIEPTIVQMKKLDIVSRFFPEYDSLFTSAKQQVAQSVPLENIELTPTQIAEKLTQETGKNISNRQVNQALEKLDLQKKENTSGGKCQWELTEKGKKYGRVYLATSTNNNWSGNQIKWSEQIIDLLKLDFYK